MVEKLKVNARKKKKAKQAPASKSPETTRRTMLKTARNSGIAAAGLVGDGHGAVHLS